MIKPLRDGMHPPSEEEGITPTAQASARRTAAPATTTNPRLWLGLKDPRIVRVSRAFGGKDRHSKVSTVKGLRDRRVRLSVQTAIQLYDLQDRLGLNQPSKVVDWLLNAAQLEIDKLPPLPFPPQNFGHFCSPTAAGESEEHHHHLDPPSHHHQRHPTTTLSIANTSAVEYVEDNGAASLRLGESNNWKPDISRPMIIQHECAADDGHRTTLAALPSSGSAATMYASFCNMDPPNSGNSGMGLCMSQAEETSHGSYRQQPAGSLSLLPGSQLMFYPSGAMPSIYQPYAHQASQNFFSNSLPAAFHSVVSSDHGFLKAPEFAKPPQK